MRCSTPHPKRLIAALVAAGAISGVVASAASATVVDLPRTHPCPAGAYPNADGGVICVYVGRTHQVVLIQADAVNQQPEGQSSD